MSRHLFNLDAFALFVRVNATVPVHLTMNQVAEAAGISKAQYFRAVHKQPVNIQAFLSLCLWMNINPFAFLLDAETGRGLARLPDGDVSRETSTETRRVPRLPRAA